MIRVINVKIKKIPNFARFSQTVVKHSQNKADGLLISSFTIAPTLTG